MDWRKLLKRLKAAGLDPETIDSIKAAKTVGEVENILAAEMIELGQGVDLAQAWTTKKVTITADAGEDVEVITEPDGELAEDGEGDGEDDPMVGKAADRSEYERWLKATAGVKGRKAFAVESDTARHEKAYDRRVKSGARDPLSGEAPAFGSGEEASFAGAWFRAAVMGTRDYSEKRADLDIIGKAHSSTDLTLGGALVPSILHETIIENKPQFGAVRRAYQNVTMSSYEEKFPRFGDDVVASESGENSTNSAQNAPTFNMVTLQARPVTAYAAIPRKLVQVSAPSIADAWTRSVARAFAKYEDDSALTGANSYAGRGLGDLTGANFSRFDNAGSAWSDWSIEDITLTIGKLGGRAWTAESPNLPPIICSANFYSSVLRRFALSAGGTTGQAILAGFGNVPESANATFDNHPVYFTSSMPTSFSQNQNVAFVGGFSQAGMVGEMLGGLEIDMSEHAGFYQDQLVFRAVSHIAINNHSADDEAEPMVVSFYD